MDQIPINLSWGRVEGAVGYKLIAHLGAYNVGHASTKENSMCIALPVGQWSSIFIHGVGPGVQTVVESSRMRVYPMRW